MSYQQFCPECLDLKSFKEISREEKIEVKQEIIVINSRYLKCDECSEEIFIPGKEDENLIKAYNIYRQNKNLLFPEEIKKIREKYGLSQRMLAKILGWGHATLSRYETGALQSISHNNELILINNPNNMLKLLDINKGNISDDDYDKIKGRIKDIIEYKKHDLYALMENLIKSNYFDNDKSNPITLHLGKSTQNRLYKTAKNEGLNVEDIIKNYVVMGLESTSVSETITNLFESKFKPNINVLIEPNSKPISKGRIKKTDHWNHWDGRSKSLEIHS